MLPGGLRMSSMFPELCGPFSTFPTLSHTCDPGELVDWVQSPANHGAYPSVGLGAVCPHPWSAPGPSLTYQSLGPGGPSSSLRCLPSFLIPALLLQCWLPYGYYNKAPPTGYLKQQNDTFPVLEAPSLKSCCEWELALNSWLLMVAHNP